MSSKRIIALFLVLILSFNLVQISPIFADDNMSNDFTLVDAYSTETDKVKVRLKDIDGEVYIHISDLANLFNGEVVEKNGLTILPASGNGRLVYNKNLNSIYITSDLALLYMDGYLQDVDCGWPIENEDGVFVRFIDTTNAMGGTLHLVNGAVFIDIPQYNYIEVLHTIDEVMGVSSPFCLSTLYKDNQELLYESSAKLDASLDIVGKGKLYTFLKGDYHKEYMADMLRMVAEEPEPRGKDAVDMLFYDSLYGLVGDMEKVNKATEISYKAYMDLIDQLFDLDLDNSAEKQIADFLIDDVFTGIPSELNIARAKYAIESAKMAYLMEERVERINRVFATDYYKYTKDADLKEIAENIYKDFNSKESKTKLYNNVYKSIMGSDNINQLNAFSIDLLFAAGDIDINLVDSVKLIDNLTEAAETTVFLWENIFDIEFGSVQYVEVGIDMQLLLRSAYAKALQEAETTEEKLEAIMFAHDCAMLYMALGSSKKIDGADVFNRLYTSSLYQQLSSFEPKKIESTLPNNASTMNSIEDEDISEIIENINNSIEDDEEIIVPDVSLTPYPSESLMEQFEEWIVSGNIWRIEQNNITTSTNISSGNIILNSQIEDNGYNCIADIELNYEEETIVVEGVKIEMTPMGEIQIWYDFINNELIDVNKDPTDFTFTNNLNETAYYLNGDIKTTIGITEEDTVLGVPLWLLEVYENEDIEPVMEWVVDKLSLRGELVSYCKVKTDDYAPEDGDTKEWLLEMKYDNRSYFVFIDVFDTITHSSAVNDRSGYDGVSFGILEIYAPEETGYTVDIYPVYDSNSGQNNYGIKRDIYSPDGELQSEWVYHWVEEQIALQCGRRLTYVNKSNGTVEEQWLYSYRDKYNTGYFSLYVDDKASTTYTDDYVADYLENIEKVDMPETMDLDTLDRFKRLIGGVKAFYEYKDEGIFFEQFSEDLMSEVINYKNTYHKTDKIQDCVSMFTQFYSVEMNNTKDKLCIQSGRLQMCPLHSGYCTDIRKHEWHMFSNMEHLLLQESVEGKYIGGNTNTAGKMFDKYMNEYGFYPHDRSGNRAKLDDYYIY